MRWKVDRKTRRIGTEGKEGGEERGGKNKKKGEETRLLNIIFMKRPRCPFGPRREGGEGG